MVYKQFTLTQVLLTELIGNNGVIGPEDGYQIQYQMRDEGEHHLSRLPPHEDMKEA
jgi:hypothetical protein